MYYVTEFYDAWAVNVLIYRWRTWDLENVSDLPKTTQLTGSELRYNLQSWCLQIQLSFFIMAYDTNSLQTCLLLTLAVCSRPWLISFSSHVYLLQLSYPSLSQPCCICGLWIAFVFSQCVLTSIIWFYVGFDNDEERPQPNTTWGSYEEVYKFYYFTNRHI